jgi:hypothetical protein
VYRPWLGQGGHACIKHNSFNQIKANAEGGDANQRSDALRVAIADAITVLATALDGSVPLEEVEKAVFSLQQQHPPTLMLSEVEVTLCSMVRTIVLAGNAALKAEMTLINPRAVGELPESLVDVVRECLPGPRNGHIRTPHARCTAVSAAAATSTVCCA